MSREQAFRHAANALDPTSPISRVLERIYINSRIDTRYFCVPDLAGEPDSAIGDGDDTASLDRTVDLGSRGEGVGARQEKFYPSDGRWEGFFFGVRCI